MASNCVLLGMDLGTSNSCVAIYRNGEIEVLDNGFDCKTVCSVVGFIDNVGEDDDPILVGESAMEACDPQQKVSGIKRILGQNYCSTLVEKTKSFFSYKIVNDNEKPAVQVKLNGENKLYSAEQIMSEIVKALKTLAENYLRQVDQTTVATVNRVVVTVPANYTESQRAATVKAVEMAGLDPLLLKEPVAAAMCYGLDRMHDKRKRKVLVFDLGAGTLDVTIMNKEGSTLDVIGNGGIRDLGGDEFTNNMVNQMAADVEKKHKKRNVLGDPLAKTRLWEACEKLKKKLSENSYARGEVMKNLLPGVHYEPIVNRKSFEDANLLLFKECIYAINNTLESASVKNREITDVVLVGGSTRIPLLRRMILECFKNADLIKGMFPEEAVVRGAAIHAAMTYEDGEYRIQNLQCINVSDSVSLSLRVGMFGGLTAVIVPRNTPIPCYKKETYITVEDDQTEASMALFQGERELQKDNTLLGTLEITGISKAPRGERSLEVHVNVDKNGFVHAMAVNTESGKSTRMNLDSMSLFKTKTQVDNIVREAQKHQAEDQKEDRRIKKRIELRNLIYDILSTARRMNQSPYSESTSKETKEINQWLDSETGQKASEEEYEQRIARVNEISHPEVSLALELSLNYDSISPVYFVK